MLYRRDRALEVVAADGINVPAVEGEAPLEIQEDGNCDEFSEVAVAEADAEQSEGGVVEDDKVLSVRNKGGAKRRPWEKFAIEKISADECLRAAAKRWLKQKEVLVKPFTTSSNRSKTVLLARCGECEKCSWKARNNFLSSDWASAVGRRTEVLFYMIEIFTKTFLIF